MPKVLLHFLYSPVLVTSMILHHAGMRVRYYL